MWLCSYKCDGLGGLSQSPLSHRGGVYFALRYLVENVQTNSRIDNFTSKSVNEVKRTGEQRWGSCWVGWNSAGGAHCPLNLQQNHVCALMLPVVCDPATPWTVTRRAPLSLGFSDQKTGVGCHALVPGTEFASLNSLGLPGGFFKTSATWEAHNRTKTLPNTDLHVRIIVIFPSPFSLCSWPMRRPKEHSIFPSATFLSRTQ